tara:strand:+ start:32 stop:634 length:603 start_codon:yes stop_codon:yes gene_type:complete
MKVKIKKGKKSKEFNLIKSWNDVTLESWLKLMTFDTDINSEDAAKTIQELSDIPKKLIKELSLSDVAIIMSWIAELQAKQDTNLKRLIKINEVEYGFHPDLDSISLGEYADIETYIKIGIEKKLPELMAVLYRPVKKKHKNGVYVIEAYDGDIRMRAEEMKKMSAEQVQGAMVFFYHFAKVLFETLQLYSIQKQKEMMKQ